jgi:CDP-glucose 4,6-dehydratase
MNFDRLVPGTIKSLLCNEPLILRSDGQFVRDYLYVEDGVDAYLTLAEQTARPGTRGNAWNFGAGNPTRVIDIIAMLGRICSKNPSPIITNSAKAEIHDQYLDSTRARQILGWVPRWSLESGLLATVAWYKAYFEKTVPSFAQIPQL